MRALPFLLESAAKELADKLPSLRRTDYDAIDELMQNISLKHNITGKKLHDLFVSKYGHTPDVWIKKIKQRNEDAVVDESKMSEIDIEYQDLQKLPDMAFQSRYKMTKQQWLEKYKHLFTQPTEFQKINKQVGDAPMEDTVVGLMPYNEGEVVPFKKPTKPVKPEYGTRTFPGQQRKVTEPEGNVTPMKKSNTSIQEAVEGEEDIQKINDFIAWAKKILHVKGDPQFTFSKDTEKAQEGHHTGVHSGNQIWVYIGNRNLIDIFRTVFHELVHQRQEELGMIKEGDSYPGSPIEVMADMLAGKYIKIYGKQHTEIFQ